jgi:hypothetical protein
MIILTEWTMTVDRHKLIEDPSANIYISKYDKDSKRDVQTEQL